MVLEGSCHFPKSKYFCFLFNLNDGSHRIVNAISIEGWDAIREFYTHAYTAVPTFKVHMVGLTGPTPDFCAVEMECQGQMATNLPGTDSKSGDVMNLIGVSLFKWKWEGEESDWDGSLSEETVRCWKIVDERAYFSTTFSTTTVSPS